MIYVLGVIGYLIVVWFLLRFFSAVHQWDEETQRIVDEWLHEAKKKAA
ncbi:MAG: hypothetical protein N3A63_04510 [Bacteroidetes bacterium]|nr:hypothetical protein [Bacteroidota bacterium]